MRLIDANAYKAILKGWLSEMHAGEDEEENAEGTAIYSCICQLDDAPTVDAVVVTRCKNCKDFRQNNENDPYCVNKRGLDDPVPDGFCNYGKPKEERENGRND